MTALSTQLLVVGGGATGLGIAWDACLRGLKVVLVEQGDLGQGTSGRYHGLLHSGGRYVISDPPSARDCATENILLRRIAPHTIEDTGGLFVATPTDPPDFPDRWFAACQTLGVPAQPVDPADALRREPLLDPHLTRAYAVHDAALDSFDLLHSLSSAVRRAGGQVWLRHRLERLIVRQGRVEGAVVSSLSGEERTIGADIVVNAAGPWSRQVAAMAGLELPIALSKGTMVAMAERLVHTVVNRLKPPADGDIIVPVGTVAVLGTTDVPVDRPTDLVIEPWEIDLLLAEGEVLLPDLTCRRALRAWAGVRPLYRPPAAAADEPRTLPRAHTILDHAERDGVEGLVSVIGGKLTTFRLMAQQTLDVVAGHLGIATPCRTRDTPLEREAGRHFTLPERWRRLDASSPPTSPPEVYCECELVTRRELETALRSPDAAELDDIRRDLRLGMGPCQAGFCGYRAAALAASLQKVASPVAWLADFAKERWRGVRPVAWGQSLRQLELDRRLYLELLGSHTSWTTL
ncbi:MAG: anaerobic glycerol-3-phosphate dehydrogenase subunit GlpA [Chloroflexota bacterium]